MLSIFLWSLPVGIALAETVDSNIQTGIADYQEQHFDQAEINFAKARKKQPNNPDLNYNLANSQYKNGKFQEALKSYADTTADDTPPDLKQNALYNSGNALFRLGKHDEAVAAYKKVLELNPQDMDAKFNLEFVREKIKEKNQQEQKQNQPQDGEPDENKKHNQKQNQDGDEEKDRENSARQENQEPSPPETQDQPEPGSDPSEQTDTEPIEQAQENTISKDQAEQWLSGLDEDLKKFSQKQARKEAGKAPVSSRDW